MPENCPICGAPYADDVGGHVCRPAVEVEGQQPMFEESDSDG